MWDVSSLTRDWTGAPTLGAGLTTGLPGKSPVRAFRRFPSFPRMRRIPLRGFFRRALPSYPNAGAGVELPPLLVSLGFSLSAVSCCLPTMAFIVYYSHSPSLARLKTKFLLEPHTVDTHRPSRCACAPRSPGLGPGACRGGGVCLAGTGLHPQPRTRLARDLPSARCQPAVRPSAWGAEEQTLRSRLRPLPRGVKRRGPPHGTAPRSRPHFRPDPTVGWGPPLPASARLRGPTTPVPSSPAAPLPFLTVRAAPGAPAAWLRGADGPLNFSFSGGRRPDGSHAAANSPLPRPSGPSARAKCPPAPTSAAQSAA